MINKITFLGAGSTIFAKNVLGDCMMTESLKSFEYALYDIDEVRLEESRVLLEGIKKKYNLDASIVVYRDRKEALKKAKYVVNAIQVGGYEPCTVIDFEIPKKYGLRQTIGDTIGVGGIMRALRTMPVLEDFLRDMEEVCPDAVFLNYTNPMSILSGFILKNSRIKSVGLCHSVQVCVKELLEPLGINVDLDDVVSEFAGINHLAFMTKIEDKYGNDLYPQIKEKAKYYLENPKVYLEEVKPRLGGIDKPLTDLVRYELMLTFGYYSPESSEHSAEYYPYFIKNKYPELLEKYHTPLDEYPGRCIKQIDDWNKTKEDLLSENGLVHKKSKEYASMIFNAIETGELFEFYGNVINDRMISNLPEDACVEIKCIADKSGINKTYFGELPAQCAAIDMTHINVHKMVEKAYETREKKYIYYAALLDPHTSSELSIDDTKAMVDELIEAHGDWLPKFN